MKNSEFLKNIVVLFSGTLFSQLLPFVILPILLTYFYTLSDFGILAVFIATADLLARIATLKLEFGIVLQKRLKDAVNLIYGAVRFSWIVALLALVIVVLFKKQIASVVGEPKLENYLFFIPIYILIVALNDVATFWFNRSNEFRKISYAKILQTTSNEGSKLVFGFLGFDFVGLIISRIIGIFVSNMYAFFQFFKSSHKNFRLLNKQHRKKIVQANSDYVYFSTPSVFVGMLINFAYLQLFLFYFGSEIVGSINVSMTYISAGFALLASSFSQVYFAKIAEIKDKQVLLKVYKKFALNLGLISSIPVLLVWFFPDSIFVSLFDESWLQLLYIMRIMVIWLAVWFVASSLSFIYMKLGRQKAMLFYDILHLALVVIGFFIGLSVKNSFVYALWGFTIAQVFYYLFVIFLAISFIKRS